ncbi:MAG: class F sortase [Anaerolineaceae bacterium]
MQRLKFSLAAGVLLIAGLVVARPLMPEARADAIQPGLAEQLRYVGRDPLTGSAAPVDDRFIAEVEKSIERYGKDDVQPIPPPPLAGNQIAWLSVPAIDVTRAPVARFGLDAFGRLEVPQDSQHVGWNPAYNALPGEGGSTFFAAHFAYAGLAGVFNRISALQPGDMVEIGLSDGTSYSYRVSSTVDYNLAAIDMGAILHGREGRESVTLMTCSGPPNADGYPQRTVVLAERVD